MNEVIAVDEYGNVISRDMYLGDLHVGTQGLGLSYSQTIGVTIILALILMFVIIYYIKRIRRNKKESLLSLSEIVEQIGVEPSRVIISDCGRKLATFLYNKDEVDKAVTYEISDVTEMELLRNGKYHIVYDGKNEENA